jgi:uncharacterized coiled-coil protein SlyX
MEFFTQHMQLLVSLATIIFLAGGIVTYQRQKTKQHDREIKMLNDRVVNVEKTAVTLKQLPCAGHQSELTEMQGTLTEIRVSIGKLKTHIEWLVKEYKFKNGSSDKK